MEGETEPWLFPLLENFFSSPIDMKNGRNLDVEYISIEFAFLCARVPTYGIKIFIPIDGLKSRGIRTDPYVLFINFL